MFKNEYLLAAALKFIPHLNLNCLLIIKKVETMFESEEVSQRYRNHATPLASP